MIGVAEDYGISQRVSGYLEIPNNRPARLFGSGWTPCSLTERDITDDYLQQINTQEYIGDDSTSVDMESQLKYIAEIAADTGRLLIGLFDTAGILRGTSGIQFNANNLFSSEMNEESMSTFGVLFLSRDSEADRWGQRLIGSVVLFYLRSVRLRKFMLGLVTIIGGQFTDCWRGGVCVRATFATSKLYRMRTSEFDRGRRG